MGNSLGGALGTTGDECMIQVDDWVRFTRNGTLFIGRVEYIRHVERLGNYYASDVELITSCGVLAEDEVLEVRRLSLAWSK